MLFKFPSLHSSMYMLKFPEFTLNCIAISFLGVNVCKNNRVVNYAAHIVSRRCSEILVVSTALIPI